MSPEDMPGRLDGLNADSEAALDAVARAYLERSSIPAPTSDWRTDFAVGLELVLDGISAPKPSA